VLLLAVGRPDMLERAGEVWWQDLPSAELLPLLPLEQSAAERLLRAYLGAPAGSPDAVLDAAVREALLSRAQGNPFFLAELLHLLVDRGALQRDGDRWRLSADLPSDLLPAGVQAVLAARIDGLVGPAKGVLRDASVLGVRVDLPGLCAVGRASGHGDPAVVQAALAVLLERRLLEADAAPEVFRFGHTLVRDVAYAGLAKAERARRHAAAAAHVAGEPSGRLGEADLVAASQGERAVRLAAEMGLPRDDPAWAARGIAFASLARLGQTALARDDNPGAEHVLARALGLDHPAFGEPLPDDLVVPVRVAHASALAALHRLEEAEAELLPALSAAEDAVRAGALVVLGDVRRKRGDSVGATQAFVSALAAAGTAGADRLTGEALRQLGLLDYFDGRLKGAEERFRQAHALALQVGDARGAGWALQHLAWSATTRGDYDLADETLEQAAEVFSGLEDTGGLSWVAGTEGFVRLLEGRLAEARDLAGSVLPLGQAMGERWGVAALLTIDALAAAELGEHQVAEEEAARALERFSEVGDVWGRAMALVALGIAARRGGEPDRAVEHLTAAAALSEQSRHPLVTSLALVALGYSHLDRADLEGAEGAVWRAQAVLAGLDLEPSAVLGAKVLLAQVLRRRGQLDAALAELDAALETSTRPALLFPRRQALAHRAGTLLELGRAQEALSAARQAVALPSEDSRSGVLALRAYGSALAACGQPDAAVAALREALELARATGQDAEAATTAALLAAAGSSS
ncbi:MAG: adenylate/guanylate cyclase with repeat, partial [Frankiales bacterium]|nr:adenylate/guanylate cyclase with repeat [Frankiales bacterium]